MNKTQLKQLVKEELQTILKETAPLHCKGSEKPLRGTIAFRTLSAGSKSERKGAVVVTHDGDEVPFHIIGDHLFEPSFSYQSAIHKETRTLRDGDHVSMCGNFRNKTFRVEPTAIQWQGHRDMGHIRGGGQVQEGGKLAPGLGDVLKDAIQKLTMDDVIKVMKFINDLKNRPAHIGAAATVGGQVVHAKGGELNELDDKAPSVLGQMENIASRLIQMSDNMSEAPSTDSPARYSTATYKLAIEVLAAVSNHRKELAAIDEALPYSCKKYKKYNVKDQ